MTTSHRFGGFPLPQTFVRLVLLASALPWSGAAARAQSPPTITTQPLGGQALPGGVVTLQVAATGAGPLGYQWRLNGSNIPAAITTAAGDGNRGYSGDGAAATVAALNLPYGVATSPSGDLYIADTGNNVIRKAGANGVIVTVAGNGARGFSGDGAAATNASLNNPAQLALDAAGNLYIADSGNNRIRKLDAQGVITTVAGNGSPGDSGDAGPATNASLRAPFGVAVDGAGVLFISDSGNHRVRGVGADDVIRPVAGDGTAGFSGDGGPAADASLNSPGGLAVDASENLFIADTLNNRARKVNVFGVITTVAGNGGQGDSGDGGAAASAGVDLPTSVGVDSFGNLFIAENENNVVRQVTPDGFINTVAGDGSYGYSGDGAAPTNASLAAPFTVAAGPFGNLFIADSGNNRVREVALATLPALTVAGATAATAGNYTVVVSNAFGSVTSAVARVTLNEAPVIVTQPASQTATAGAAVTLEVGAAGFPQAAYQWELNGAPLSDQIYTVAGGGSAGIQVNGPATGASLNSSTQVTVDAAGDILISDTNDHVIRKVSANGVIQTIVGNGNSGFSGDGGSALNASLTYPSGLALDASGNLFFADVFNNRIRKVATNGVITTIAGNGGSGAFTGGGGPATAATLNLPVGVAVDAAGDVFIADPNQMAVLKVDVHGTITRVAGTGAQGYSGDGGPATDATLNQPFGVAVDPSGNLLIADSYNYRIRQVGTNGVITTIIGNGTAGFSGDGGPAAGASIGDANNVAIDSLGNLYFAEYDNNRVRRVGLDHVITTIAGSGTKGFSGDGGPALQAKFNQPYGVAAGSGGTLLVGDSGNNRVRVVDLSTLPVLTVADFSTANAGSYQVIVSNASGSATSAVAQVTLPVPPTPPVILAQPAGVTAPPGAAVTLEVGASGSPPLGYQWELNGAILPDQIHTFAGGGSAGYDVNGPATSASLNGPYQVAVDAEGNVIIADTNNHVIRKVGANGVIQTIVGTGNYGFSGDGGPALNASMTYPSGLALDASGNLYFADVFNARVRKVGATGVITTIAGNGGSASGFTGAGGPATAATMSGPVSVAVDAAGDVLIADRNFMVVLKVDTHGIISVVAGTGQAGSSGDGGPATKAALYNPAGVMVDPLGNVLIADSGNNRIRQVDTNGVITTVVGNGAAGFSGDGGPATSARIGNVNALVIDASGNLYFAEFDNHRVRKVGPDHVITTIAGTGTAGFSGDGGPALQAKFNQPYGVALGAAGNLLVGDFGNNRVREVELTTLPVLKVAGLSTANSGNYQVVVSNPNGSVTSAVAQVTLPIPPVLAGPPASQTALAGGAATFTAAVSGPGPFSYQWQKNGVNLPNNLITTAAGDGVNGYSGDGGAAVQAALNDPFGAAVSAFGNVYIVDQENNRVRRVDAGGVITTVAGNGTQGFSGDGGAATAAEMWGPAGVAVDPAGRLYVADQSNQVIRKVDVNGVITTVAGDGIQGSGGDGGAATAAALSYPVSVAVDAAGNLYIADLNNHRVRKVESSGIITTVAGDGTQGFAGDGGAATAARLNSPTCVVVDASGNLFISDDGNNRIRRVGVNGIITTVAGGGAITGDGGAATNAALKDPVGVAVDASGDLFIAERGSQRVREVSPGGVISTAAGSGAFGFSGDGGPAAAAAMEYPSGVALDASGNLYITDRNNNRIREVLLAGIPSLTLGDLSGTNAGAYRIVVSNPYGSVTSAVATLTIALPELSAAASGTSGILLGATAPPGASYVLQAAASLTPPVEWLPLATNAATGAGEWSHLDAFVPGRSLRFYRLAAP